MAKKIPLEQTIGGAYRFLFSNILSIIGIVWFPLLVFGGLAGLAIWHGFVANPLPTLTIDDNHHDPAQVIAFLHALLPTIWLVQLCVLALALMVTVGLVRKALGMMPGPTFIYFNLGPSFWRMLAAAIVCWVLVVLFVVACVIVGALWHTLVAPRLPQTVGRLLSVLAIMAMILFVIYAIVRLVFFLPATVVAEDRIWVGRSWELGGGNFWRTVVVFLAVFVPPLVVYAVLDGAVRLIFIGPLLQTLHPMVGQMREQHVLDLAKVMHAVMGVMMKAGPVALSLLIAVPVVFDIALRALHAGALATAYRGVTETETPAAD